MTREEFLAKVEEDSEWAPGWDAIEAEFERLYPGQNPAHYATNLVSRATFGGPEYLDGYSIYDSPKGYKHIVTFGMTELYADVDMLGKEYNNWGYEMTMKLKEESTEDSLWALSLLGNLARYTYTQERFFEPYQYISGGGNSIHQDEESAITALLTVYDTEAMTQESVYGKTEFIQLVGITEQEFQAIKANRQNAKLLVERMKKDNPDLVTDMSRTHSYLSEEDCFQEDEDFEEPDYDEEDYDEEDFEESDYEDGDIDCEGNVYEESDCEDGINYYIEIFGEEIGEELLNITTRMSEMNENDTVQKNMEEYMQLSNRFQEIMEAEDGMRRIAEYNARQAAKVAMQDEDEDEDEDAEADEFYNEEIEELRRQQENQIIIKTYCDTYGVELGKQLADIAIRMTEMTKSGAVQEHMDEYMQLSNQLQELLSSEEAQKKLAEKGM